MKKKRRILMIEKMKPFKNLQAIVLLVLSALLNTGCYTATLAPSEDNLRSKQLTPPAGKALVYFYLDGGPYALVDVTASLNGFKSRISDKTYMLWEVFPGEYLLTFAGGKLEIQCEANQIYYYCVSSASMFGETLGQASDATGRAKVNEFSLVKWFKDVPAPPKTKVTSGEEVAAHVTEPTESEKAKMPAEVPPDEAIAIIEVKIDKVSDESRTFYDTMGRPIATVPRYVFSPDEHIRSSLIQAKFLIASEDMKETPIATLAVRYQEKNKRPGLGSPKTFFLSYELTHHTRGMLFEGGVGPQGCDTQEQFENHPQFRDIGLLIRDAFIRSEAKATAAEAMGNETVEAEETVSTAQQAGDPNTDSDRVDTKELKSVKNTDNIQEIDSGVAAKTGSATTESTRLGKKSESTAIVEAVPPTSTPVPFVIRNPKFEAVYKGECDTDATITSVESNSLRAGGKISIRNGKFALWCYGAKHTWKGRLTYADHVFDSDNKSPLQFMVDEDKGYVYLGGKGTVTLPDGTSITLPVEVIGTIRLIMQKDSDVKVTEYLYSRYNPLQKIGSVTRDQFKYEPDEDIKASLKQMGFEVIPEDSNKPGDATLVVHYEEKRRGSGLDSPTAYYFSFNLSHRTKGALLKGSAKATGCDSAEELQNDPQFRDIGVIVRKAFVQEILGHKETQQRKVPTRPQLSDTAKSKESVAKKSPESEEKTPKRPPDKAAEDVHLTEITYYDKYGRPARSDLQNTKGKTIARRIRIFAAFQCLQSFIAYATPLQEEHIEGVNPEDIIYLTNYDAGEPKKPKWLCLDETGDILKKEGEPILVEPFQAEQPSTFKMTYNGAFKDKRIKKIYPCKNCAEKTGNKECAYVW